MSHARGAGGAKASGRGRMMGLSGVYTHTPTRTHKERGRERWTDRQIERKKVMKKRTRSACDALGGTVTPSSCVMAAVGVGCVRCVRVRRPPDGWIDRSDGFAPQKQNTGWPPNPPRTGAELHVPLDGRHRQRAPPGHEPAREEADGERGGDGDEAEGDGRGQGLEGLGEGGVVQVHGLLHADPAEEGGGGGHWLACCVGLWGVG